MKIDVEGLEHEVLDGLADHHAQLPRDGAIIMEVSPERLQSVGRSAAELFSLLSSWGYEAFIVPNEYQPSFYVHRRAHKPRRLADVDSIDKMVDVAFVRGDAVSVIEAMAAAGARS